MDGEVAAAEEALSSAFACDQQDAADAVWFLATLAIHLFVIREEKNGRR